jgi:threonine synthase
MLYLSTRGQAEHLDFSGILLAGLASDGGLYMPETWPEFSAAELRALRGLPYPELAARIIAPFVGSSLPFATLQTLCRRAYASFTHPAIVPLIQLSPTLHALELFHGPTLAFKDLALQLAGHLFEHVLAARDQKITIVGATSGDTGSAAIAATAGRKNIDIVILHPAGKTSDVQRRQMTTVNANNVLNLAIEGNFDDCQDIVKALFADGGFRSEVNLSAVNSINFARIAAQIPYYVTAALTLGAPDRPLAVAVPTGNFGNVLAAWGAAQLGIPIEKFLVASNHNDILHRFLASNDMSIQAVTPSLSPSMDIQVSSNFERLLFEFLGRDPEATRLMMYEFRANGHMPVKPAVWRKIRGQFTGFTLSDDATIAEIRRTWREAKYLADPHTAIALAAAREQNPIGLPVIAAATAHPAKFPDAIEKAVGFRPPLPPHLADLYDRGENYETMPNDWTAVAGRVRQFVKRNFA